MAIISSGNRVAKNTGILYARMLMTVGVSLYTTRLVLNGLGVVDYGIYNLIAGLIIMLSFLNSAMATSTQRYLSFYQGKDDKRMQRLVFSNSLVLHIIIGLLIITVIEIAGFFIFDSYLKIPVERIVAAKVIYHVMGLTVFFTVVTVPFSGSIISHENIIWVAVINIIETLLKLGISMMLYSVTADKLIFYGCSMAVITLITLLFYAIYCIRQYEECRLTIIKDYNKSIIIELRSFAGWNLFGALCGLSRTQGLAIILNFFLGAVANAAYGIANQISAQLSFFSVTLLQALNPQIMKSEGEGNRYRMLRLSMIASKFGFFLLSFIVVPCIFEMPYLLKFWLKNIPENTILYCNLILINIMVNQLTVGLQAAFQATGKIKMYQIIVGSVLLFNLPLAYYLLKYNFPINAVLISYILIEFIGCVLRVYLLKLIAGLSISEYLEKVIFKEIIPLTSIISAAYFISTTFKFEYRFVVNIIISFVLFVVSIYFTGLCKDEKYFIKNLFSSLKLKMINFFITFNNKHIAHL